MNTLEIDHLRARYHDVDPARLSVLDHALAELTAHALDDQLVGLNLDDELLPRAFAVCVAELTVDVEVDGGSSPRAMAGRWAATILDALRCEIGSNDHGDGMVVYESVTDALVDLVTSVSAGDLSRLWAWHQVGVMPRQVWLPTADDIAGALVDRSSSIIAVLATAGPPCRSLFGPTDWLRLARAVGPLVVDRDDTSDTVGSPDARFAVDTAAFPLARSIAAVVPASAWSATDQTADRRSLAVLALGVARPHLARTSAAITTVAAVAPGSARDPLDEGTTRTVPGIPDPHKPLAGKHTLSHHEGHEPTDREMPSPPDGVVVVADDIRSEWGGVWFLVHALRSLDVVGRLSEGQLCTVDPIDALTSIVVTVTGAPDDDPSLKRLVGRNDDQRMAVWTGTDGERGAVRDWAAATNAWLAQRAGGRLVSRRVPPGGTPSIWRRSVSISTSPGWIEVTSAASDVDLDVRRAGLDIDPGFVWWLGAVVRFRYV
jgi:hypothetical protein